MIAIITAVAITLTLLLAAAGYMIFRGGQTKSQRRSDRIVITAPQVELCMTPHPKPPSVQTPGSPTPKDFTLWLPPSPKANFFNLAGKGGGGWGAGNATYDLVSGRVATPEQGGDNEPLSHAGWDHDSEAVAREVKAAAKAARAAIQEQNAASLSDIAAQSTARSDSSEDSSASAESLSDLADESDPAPDVPVASARFSLGATVLLERSSGGEAEAKIIGYNPNEALYHLYFDDGTTKSCREESMKLAGAQTDGAVTDAAFAAMAPAEQVVFVRTNGFGDWDAFMAWVANEYEPDEVAHFEFNEEALQLYAYFRDTSKKAANAANVEGQDYPTEDSTAHLDEEERFKEASNMEAAATAKAMATKAAAAAARARAAAARVTANAGAVEAATTTKESPTPPAPVLASRSLGSSSYSPQMSAEDRLKQLQTMFSSHEQNVMSPDGTRALERARRSRKGRSSEERPVPKASPPAASPPAQWKDGRV